MIYDPTLPVTVVFIEGNTEWSECGKLRAARLGSVLHPQRDGLALDTTTGGVRVFPLIGRDVTVYQQGERVFASRQTEVLDNQTGFSVDSVPLTKEG